MIISQYIHLSNHYMVHLKLMPRVSYISIKPKKEKEVSLQPCPGRRSVPRPWIGASEKEPAHSVQGGLRASLPTHLGTPRSRGQNTRGKNGRTTDWDATEFPGGQRSQHLCVRALLMELCLLPLTLCSTSSPEEWELSSRV